MAWAAAAGQVADALKPDSPQMAPAQNLPELNLGLMGPSSAPPSMSMPVSEEAPVQVSGAQSVGETTKGKPSDNTMLGLTSREWQNVAAAGKTVGELFSVQGQQLPQRSAMMGIPQLSLLGLDTQAGRLPGSTSQFALQFPYAGVGK